MEIADMISFESSHDDFLIRFSGEDPLQIRQRLAIALGTAIRASLRSNAIEPLSTEQLTDLLSLNFLSVKIITATTTAITDKTTQPHPGSSASDEAAPALLSELQRAYPGNRT